jgi:predicted DNA-binding protein (MmcQ/YjbR family)
MNGCGLPPAIHSHAWGAWRPVHFPWGHAAIKVRGKIFVTLVKEDDRSALSLSAKLPVSRDFALIFDWAEPTGYGLGRSGWISARFKEGDEPDLEMLTRWIRESYRAIAPKKLSAALPPDQ